jgi:hypothetical protein
MQRKLFEGQDWGAMKKLDQEGPLLENWLTYITYTKKQLDSKYLLCLLRLF